MEVDVESRATAEKAPAKAGAGRLPEDFRAAGARKSAGATHTWTEFRRNLNFIVFVDESMCNKGCMLYRDAFVDRAPATSDSFQLRRSTRMLSRYWNDHLRENGALRHTQFDVLAVIHAQGSPKNCISELASVLGMAPCTLSRSLKTLERNGLVCFPPDLQKDQRSKIPALTDLGREALGVGQDVVEVVIQPRVTNAFRKLPATITQYSRALHALLHSQVFDEIRYREEVRRGDLPLSYICNWYGLTPKEAWEWVIRRRAARYGRPPPKPS